MAISFFQYKSDQGRIARGIAFWLLTLVFIIKIFRKASSGPKRKSIGRAYRILFTVLAVFFCLLLAYQATWRLAGFMRPEFVDFMKRYNRRPDNPAARMVRGRIMDARGAVLAEQDKALSVKRIYHGGAAFCHVV